jgi:hypothetical protein
LFIDERALGPHHPDTAVTLNNLANSLLNVGERDQALDALRKAYEAATQTLGSEHTISKMVQSNLEKITTAV